MKIFRVFLVAVFFAWGGCANAQFAPGQILTATDLNAALANTEAAAIVAVPVKSVAGRTGNVTINVGDVSGAAPTTSPYFNGGVNADTIATSGYAYINGSIIGLGGEYLSSAAGAATPLYFQSGGVSRWSLSKSPGTEGSGVDTNATLTLSAFGNSGNFLGNTNQWFRTSGPANIGPPTASQVATNFYQSADTGPAGASGNTHTTTDIQTAHVVNNPFSTTSGSSSVNVNIPNHGFSFDGINGSAGTWAAITGATSIGGLTLNGYFQVTAIVDPNNFTIKAGSNATSTVTAAVGTGVSIRPSWLTMGQQFVKTSYSGAAGFAEGNEYIHFLVPQFFAPGYVGQGSFDVLTCPNDNTHAWACTGQERDIANLGGDQGYYYDIFGTPRASAGQFYIPITSNYGSPGGGVGYNGAVADVCGHDNDINSVTYLNNAWYNCFQGASNSLVPITSDPKSHGGVAFVSNGAKQYISTVGTTIGSSVITLTFNSGVNVIGATGSIELFNFATANGLTINGTFTLLSNPTATTVTLDVASVNGSTKASATGTVTDPGNAHITFQQPYAAMEVYDLLKVGIDHSTATYSSGNAEVLKVGQCVAFDASSTFRVCENAAGTKLEFFTGSTAIMSVDGSGNLRTLGTVTASTTP